MNFVRAVGVLSVTAAVVSSLVGVTTVPVAVPAAEPTSAFIVELAPGETALDVSSEIAENLNTDIQIDETFDTLLDGFSAELTPSEVQALQARPDVLAVYPDLPVSINATQTDAPWNLSRLDQSTAPADATYTYPDSAGSGARIYVVDTGVSANPAQFGSRLLPGFTAISDGNGTADCNGHGTHVAGTVASTTYGVAKQASIVPVRVFGCTGSALTASVLAGLDWIAANHPAGTPGIVNLSLGSADPVTTTTDPLTTAVNTMSDRGFVMVVAAGNSNANACTYSPARAAKALTVGATTASDARAGYSNFGSCIDLFAPGSDIRSLQWNNPSGSTVMSGTSMAAPHVAGVAALVWGEGPSATASAVQSSTVADAVAGSVSSPGLGSPNGLLNTRFISTTGSFTSLLPARIADTRNISGEATIDGLVQGIGAIGPGQTLRVPILGRAGIPATGVGAVALNVTATSPTASSYLTVFPTGETLPRTSNLNFTASQTIPNSVIAKIGTDGSISIHNNSGSTHVIVDISGWFPTTGSFTSLLPARIADTRNISGEATIDGLVQGIGAIGPGQTLRVPILGRAGIPATGVGAVALNVTATSPTASSYLTVFPTGETLPRTSNLNFTASQTIPNSVIVKIGTDGSISIHNNSGSTHVIVDISGWFPQ
jgi:subtilisin family serine protease